MTYSSGSGRPPVRTPEELVDRWQHRRAAWLNDLVRTKAAARIEADDEFDMTASLTVRALGRNRTYWPNGGYSVQWRVEDVSGDHPNLERLAAEVAHIACEPIASTPYFGNTEKGPIRYYDDMLFEGGKLAVASINMDFSDRGDVDFDMGRVVGLTVVTSKGDYPVWVR